MTPPVSKRGRIDQAPPPEQPDFEVLQEFAGALAERLLPGLLDGVARSTSEILETVRLEGDASRASARADARDQSRKLVESVRERRDDAFTPAPVAEVLDEFGAEERLAQRELALAYDAWRTLLGRSGAFAVFLAERVGEKHEPNAEGNFLLIRSAPFAGTNAGWTLVAHIAGLADPVHERLPDEGLPVVVAVPHLRADQDLTRLEIRDRNGRPRYVGVGPALQTNNQERDRSLDPIKDR